MRTSTEIDLNQAVQVYETNLIDNWNGRGDRICSLFGIVRGSALNSQQQNSTIDQAIIFILLAFIILFCFMKVLVVEES